MLITLGYMDNLKRRLSKYCVNSEWQWQSDFWDTQMQSGEKYRQTWEYIRMNPVEKGLILTPPATQDS